MNGIEEIVMAIRGAVGMVGVEDTCEKSSEEGARHRKVQNCTDSKWSRD